MELRPVGVIHSPFKTTREAPRQGRPAGAESEIEIFPEFAPALKDIEKATHLIVLYWCHLASRDVLQRTTPHGPEIRGVFACRAPFRPNPIAFCVVELLRVDGERLRVRGLDAVNGSPLLDLKPYFPELDSIPEARVDWPKKDFSGQK
ncbi:MAG: tRNA (N6-threonylcarbamoyladenosine(37)-N6)-methyltransferase TrmO [Bacillota bacterium]